MNVFKRFLSMLLVLCLLIGVGPMTAHAEETDGAETEAAETAQEPTDPTGEPAEETAAAEATEAVEEPAEPTEDPYGIVLADTETLNANKPADGTTSGQPFASGTGSSELFRIPAITTLSDGTIVAAADARWNDRSDSGNIDTLVSWSKDNGSTWNYTFANYIGDYSNAYDITAATFIDPALAVDGNGTIYMMVDLFPGQASGDTMCIVAALAGTGMDGNGHLLVSNKNDNTLSDMNYYVGDFDSSNMATLYTSEGVDSGYDVDAWFNMYDNTASYMGNLFTYGDTGFYVYQTSYLYLTKSTDGGKTWSAPTLINNQVKNSSEKFYGVGPASGIVTSDGTIMYTCYTYDYDAGGDGYTSTIYSRDGGKTWKRGTNLNSQSSEAALAEADGVVYLFNRYGQCAYTSDYGASWTYLSTSAGYATGCEVSAMTYSKLIDGQTAILVCGPTSGRTTGKIFVGLVNEDKSINWKYTYTVDGTNPFQYSAMTELADGSIGLLYENTGTAGITYKNIAITDIVGGDAEITEITEPFNWITDANNSGEIQVPVSAGVNHVHVKETTVASITADYVAYDIHLCKNANENCTDCTGCDAAYTGSATVTLPLPEKMKNAKVKAFVVESDGSIKDIYNVENDGTNVTFEAPHFSVLGIAELGENEEAYTSEEVVTLYVGESTVITDTTGNHQSTYTGSGLDENVATVTVSGKDAADDAEKEKTEITTDTFEAGKQYLIVSKRAATNEPNYSVLTADSYTSGAADWLGPLTGLEMNGDSTADSAELWNITPSGNGYLISQNGSYLTFGNKSASVGTDETVLTLTYTNNGWTIVKDSYYLSDLAGTTLQGAFGWYESGDAGNYWRIYEITDGATSASTEITITGVSAGTTTAIVGNTKYTIEVLPIPECVTPENSPFIVGGDFVGAGDYLTKLTMSSVLTGYDIALKSDSYTDTSTIEWSIADESIATVTVAADGKTAQVNAVSPGITYLTVTIDGTSYTMPVVIVETASAADNYKYCSLHITGIYDTTVYYSWNCSGNAEEFVEAVDGEAIWTVFNSGTPYCINFYGAPDEGYALTYMAATNSKGQYLALNDKEDPTNCDFYTKSGAGYNEWNDGSFSPDEVAQDIYVATILGCDGAMGFSRKYDDRGEVKCNLTFASDKLPKITKEINGVLSATIVKNDDGTETTVYKSADWENYYDGIYAQVDDLLYFTIEIYQEAPDAWQYDANGNYLTKDGGRLAALTYSDSTLNDILDGAYFYTKAKDEADGDRDGDGTLNNDGYIADEVNRLPVEDVTDALNRGWTEAEIEAGYRTHPYYVVYHIQPEDVNELITNHVDFNYTYASAYSGNTLTTSGSAEAALYVVGQTMPDLVIDFGLPVQFKAGKEELIDKVNVGMSNNAQGGCLYGKVSIEPTGEDVWTVTYTPKTILQNYDVVYLLGDDGKVLNYFRVYPATTVYYEETFLEIDENNTSKWEAKGDPVNDYQSAVVLGEAGDNNYGFDSAYADDGGVSSNGTYITSNNGGLASFTFTGTGFELYANSNSGSGCVTVYSEGELSKLYFIDTVLNGSLNESDITNDQQDDATEKLTYYNLPIISETELPYGTYVVQIKQTNGSEPIYIDGVRIINTIDESTLTDNTKSIYYADREDKPVFYELRDYVLHAIGVEDVTESDYIVSTVEDAVKKMAGQVYNAISDDDAAIIIDTDNTSFKDNHAQDLLDNGPKNELYLYPNQTLVFKVTTKRVMQLGLKSPTGSANFTITVTENEDPTKTKTLDLNSLSTTVDMFYKIADKKTDETTYTVSITVTEGVLSVTDLKICDDPGFSFKPLTQEDIEDILLGLYDVLDEEISERVDINGDGSLNAKDATMILRWVVGKLPDVPANFEQIADINGDGIVNAKDATMILRFVVGKVKIPGWENE